MGDTWDYIGNSIPNLAESERMTESPAAIVAGQPGPPRWRLIVPEMKTLSCSAISTSARVHRQKAGSRFGCGGRRGNSATAFAARDKGRMFHLQLIARSRR